MNYQILIGKTVNINDSIVTVSSIKKIKDIDYTTKYCINDGPMFTHFDVAIAVTIIENEIKEANRPKGLAAFFNRFGLWYRVGVINPELVSASTRDAFTGALFGFRKYGYRSVGFFYHIRFFSRTFEFEFSWSNKEEYVGRELPDPFLQYTKIF
jgi:hypothetical protein